MNITLLMQMLDQLKLFHWQTASFAEHKALGAKYDSLADLVDKLVETYFGKHGRIVPKGGVKTSIENYSEDFDVVIDGYETFVKQMDFRSEPDLANIQADMLIEINHLKYLLTLS